MLWMDLEQDKHAEVQHRRYDVDEVYFATGKFFNCRDMCCKHQIAAE